MIIAICLIFALTTGTAFAANTSQWLQASNVRTYSFGNNVGFVVQVGGQAVDSLCQYPDHLQINADDPNYDTAVKLFLSQWTKDPNVHFAVYYTPGECSGGVNTGNVKVQGFYFE